MSDPSREEMQKAAIERLDSLESDLVALQREADESSRLVTLGLMAATIAHELRNILTPVLSYAQLARMRPDDEKMREKSFERTISGIQAAAEILETTLDFATATAPRATIVEANVQEVLERALKCLARDPAKDGVTVDVDMPNDLVVAIKPLSLQQVFMNLILNAIKAIKSDGNRSGRIEIRAKLTADPSIASIEVTDNGPGLPDGLKNRIFEPFVTSSGPGKGGGTGLGLAICRRILKGSGGEITASSTTATSGAGTGTTFSMTLPVVKATDLRMAG